MDSCTSHPSLLSVEQAVDKILSQATAIQQQEWVPLEQALARITAQPIVSPIDIPPFDNSAMDGYAVRLADVNSQQPLAIAGKAFAGTPYHGEWPTGSCIRIMTGAAIPTGTEAVIMQEQATVVGDRVTFSPSPRAGQNIRRQGEDIQRNAAVLPSGTKLSVTHLPLLASLGIAQVCVIRRLKVAIFSTGDELRPIGTPLGAGEIYDSNRFAVRLMLERMNCEVLDLGIIPDDPTAIRSAFLQADQHADLVISSGGVSVGEADFTKSLLDELGTISFWQLAMKPGKPFAFGKLQHTWFCGLPGNPVSAAVTFYQLVQPLLAKLAGHSQWQPPQRFQVRTQDALKKAPGRLDFQRGILSLNEAGEWSVSTTGHQGSHIFSSLSQGNCFIVLESERGSIAAGEWVTVEPFNALLS